MRNHTAWGYATLVTTRSLNPSRLLEARTSGPDARQPRENAGESRHVCLAAYFHVPFPCLPELWPRVRQAGLLLSFGESKESKVR